MAAEPQPPPGESEQTGMCTPRRPATRPAQLSLDAQLCNVYLMAVVRDKKRSDGEKLARFLWGEDAADIVESEALFVDNGDAIACASLVASPVRVQELDPGGDEAVEDGDDVVSTSVSQDAASGWHCGRTRRASCPAGRPSLLQWSRVMVPDAVVGSSQPFGRASEPRTSLGRRWGAMWVNAGSGHDPSHDDSHVPQRSGPMQHGGNSCCSRGFVASWSSSIASHPGFSLPPSPSPLGPPSEAVPFQASLQASLTSTPDHAPAHPEHSPVKHSRQEGVVPQVLSLHQLLGDGGGEPDEEPSTPAPAPPTRSSVRESPLSAPQAQPLSLRQLLGYGGGEPVEEPRRRPTKQSRRQEVVAPKPLSLRQLLGYGGGEPDDEPPSPSPLSPARSPIQESFVPRPLSQTAGQSPLESRLLEELPFSSTGEHVAIKARAISLPPPPAPVAAMCAMRVKHGATGWF
ncbi:hypothetical protein HRG_003301 [Hirsutella rhossiliensis]|uniref:Uncharacterized protein n=1 Tax=Hirsutella rhossiliensis TaxID=111463 RepID=A0A9P8SKZ1_9HYPO|nr:uncharacterized protein HRG_03301 [Hirsutella rhossiliensis]KAH0965285.1 hypothetical protein HRG_03301 [Hirsutella rhossiliensis]